MGEISDRLDRRVASAGTDGPDVDRGEQIAALLDQVRGIQRTLAGCATVLQVLAAGDEPTAEQWAAVRPPGAP
jgi:hypothetical protein